MYTTRTVPAPPPRPAVFKRFINYNSDFGKKLSEAVVYTTFCPAPFAFFYPVAGIIFHQPEKITS